MENIKSMTRDILMEELTPDLVKRIAKALEINKHLTSTYALTVSVEDILSTDRNPDPSKSGFYFILKGTRSGVNFFYNNNLEFSRKPNSKSVRVVKRYNNLRGFEESFWHKWAEKWLKNDLVEKIIKKSDGYYVTSEDGKKNLGGPYGTEDEAKKRLQQVHYFKNKDKNKKQVKEGIGEKIYYRYSNNKYDVGDIITTNNTKLKETKYYPIVQKAYHNIVPGGDITKLVYVFDYPKLRDEWDDDGFEYEVVPIDKVEERFEDYSAFIACADLETIFRIKGAKNRANSAYTVKAIEPDYAVSIMAGCYVGNQDSFRLYEKFSRVGGVHSVAKEFIGTKFKVVKVTPIQKFIDGDELLDKRVTERKVGNMSRKMREGAEGKSKNVANQIARKIDSAFRKDGFIDFDDFCDWVHSEAEEEFGIHDSDPKLLSDAISEMKRIGWKRDVDFTFPKATNESLNEAVNWNYAVKADYFDRDFKKNLPLGTRIKDKETGEEYFVAKYLPKSSVGRYKNRCYILPISYIDNVKAGLRAEGGYQIDALWYLSDYERIDESLTEAANDYPTDPNKLKARLREINKAIERGEDPEYFAYEKKKIFDQLDSLGSNYYDESLGKSQITEKASPEGYSPKKTGKAYKVFRVKNGKLYPPMVANAGGEDTPIGVWLDAEEGEFAGLSKTGRPQVKSTGSGNLAYRPGWHLGDVPRAPQFDRKNKETGELEFPKDFVWAECDYAMDVDYQSEADEQGHMRTKVDDQGNVSTYRSDKYQHSLAGLPKLPKDGYYKYRTNPRPDTVPWVITGQMKVNKLLSDDEVNEILRKKGIEPIHRQGGDKTLAELGLKESMTKGNNVLTEAVNEIWASDGMQSYYYTADISELKDELEDIGVDYSDMDEDDIRRYFLDDEFTMEQDYETFEYSILPEISKQCYADVLVLFGDYARWDGSRGAAKVLPKADKLSSFIYPEYEATTRIFQDETGVYYTQSTHDTPMGGTKIYLYSLKSEDDIQKLEDLLIKTTDWYDPEYDYPVDFLEDHSDYNDIKEYIDNGILTPIKL